jgi:hypothetical protein
MEFIAMNQIDIDTLNDAVRLFGTDKKYIVTFGGSTVLITVLRYTADYHLLGEVWNDGNKTIIKTFNNYKLME